MKPLTTEFFGNYTLQDLLGAAQALRLAAAKLRAEGGTSQQALDKLVGLRDGSDALGAAPSSLLLFFTSVSFRTVCDGNGNRHGCTVALPLKPYAPGNPSPRRPTAVSDRP